MAGKKLSLRTGPASKRTTFRIEERVDEGKIIGSSYIMETPDGSRKGLLLALHLPDSEYGSVEVDFNEFCSKHEGPVQKAEMIDFLRKTRDLYDDRNPGKYDGVVAYFYQDGQKVKLDKSEPVNGGTGYEK